MPDDDFNKRCENLLVKYKRRNSRRLSRRRLESLCTGSSGQKGDVVQTMFGGSVKKGTYVTGLSDVDAPSDCERVFACEPKSPTKRHRVRKGHDSAPAPSE